jgi:hypothetical protein
MAMLIFDWLMLSHIGRFRPNPEDNKIPVPARVADG